MKRISAKLPRKLGRFFKRVVTFSVCVTMAALAPAQDYIANYGPQQGGWPQAAYAQQASGYGYFGSHPHAAYAGHPAYYADGQQAAGFAPAGYAQPAGYAGAPAPGQAPAGPAPHQGPTWHQQVGGFLQQLVPAPSQVQGNGLFQSLVPTSWNSNSQVAFLDDNGVPGNVGASPYGGETNASFQDVERNFYFWLKHIEGHQYGDTSAYTALGGSWYTWADDLLLMLDGQFILTNHGEAAGNIGLIARTYTSSDAIIGANAWYDVGESRLNNTFHQVGFGLEYLTCCWNARLNIYAPVWDESKVLSQHVVGNPGNPNITYFGNFVGSGGRIHQLQEVAVGGFDVEISRHLDILHLPTAEAFIGFYDLSGGLGGLKGGVRGYVLPDLAAEVTVLADDANGTNAFGGFTWFFGGPGGYSPCGNTCNDKLTIPVIRNEQIATEVRNVVSFDDLNLVEKNNRPVRVVHVDNNDPGNGAMTGTFENPLTSLDQIEPNSQPGDIILVHAGTTYTNQQAILQNEQSFIGEGRITLHSGQPNQMTNMDTGVRIMTDNMGNIMVPETATGSSMLPVPVLRNNQDPFMIQLASIGNTMDTVSGFVLDGLGGSGTAITDPGGQVADSTFRALVVRGWGNNGISLANGVGGMNLFTKLDMDDINGDDILLNQAGPGSMTRIEDTTMNGSGGNGLHVSNAAAGAMVTATTGPIGGGLDIGLMGNGPVFSGGGAAIQLDGNDLAALINLEDVDIRTNGAKGIAGNGIGTVEVNTAAAAAGNDLIAMNSGAIDVDGGAIGAGGWTFDVLTATNTGAMEGIDIDNLSGFGNAFTVTGLTTVDTTGGTSIAGIDIADSDATFTFMGGVDIDDTTGHGIAATNVQQLNIPDAGPANSIAGTGLDGVNLTNTNAVLDDFDIDSAGEDGIHASVTDGVDRLVMLSNIDIDAAAARGIRLFNSGGAGDLDVSIDTSVINSVGIAIEVDKIGDGNLIVNMMNTHTLGSTNGAGIDMDGSNGAGTLFVEDLGSTTVIGGNTTTGGALFEEVVFDAVAGGTVQQVSVVSMDIGTLASRVNGDGFSGTNIRGDLLITDLDVANADGTGIIIKNGPGFNFTFTTAAGSTVDTLRGTAIDIDPVATDMTFDSVTSIDAGGPGIRLDGVTAADGTLDGNVINVTGTTTIRGTTGNGIEITNGVGTHTFADVDIEMTTGNGIFLEDLISSGTAPGAFPGMIDDGVLINGGSIRSTQGMGIVANDVRSVLVQNVEIRSADIGIDLLAEGSVMAAQILNNGIDTGAPEGVDQPFSLRATVDNMGTMCLDAVGNDDGMAADDPNGDFRLNNAGTPTSILGITQASLGAMSAANNGVGISDNGTITFNCDLNNP